MRPELRQFNRDCEGLLMCIRTAADPAMPEYTPYYGNRIGRAVWQAKYVYRRAVKLGLISRAYAERRAA